MLSSPQIFEMLEKLGLFELLPYLNRVFKNKTATRRMRQVAEASIAIMHMELRLHCDFVTEDC